MIAEILLYFYIIEPITRSIKFEPEPQKQNDIYVFPDFTNMDCLHIIYI